MSIWPQPDVEPAPFRMARPRRSGPTLLLLASAGAVATLVALGVVLAITCGAGR